MAEQVLRKGRFKNAPKFGAYVRFMQVVAPFFRTVCRSLRSRALPATSGPQKLSAAGLGPAKLCGTRPLQMERGSNYGLGMDALATVCLLEHELYYGLGMDALVIALMEGTEVWFGQGCSGNGTHGR